MEEPFENSKSKTTVYEVLNRKKTKDDHLKKQLSIEPLSGGHRSTVETMPNFNQIRATNMENEQW